MNLTDEQQRFIEEYLVDLNATQAAIRTGYSSEEASTLGFEFLKNWRIAAQISEEKQSRIKRVAVSPDYVIEKIAAIIDRSLQDQVVDESANIGFVDSKGRKFESTNILRACELLGKHLGMFREKAAGIDNDGLCDNCRSRANLTDEELSARLIEHFRPLGFFSD